MEHPLEAESGSDDRSLEEFLADLPPLLPYTHSRFPTTPSRTFREATTNAEPLEASDLDSADGLRIFDFLEEVSGSD